MAQYEIRFEQSLGWSHTGEETVEGIGTVELTGEEADCLLDLIREYNTTDVEELELENEYPDIYEKLDEAYCRLAEETMEIHGLWYCYCEGVYSYDLDEVEEYCRENCHYDKAEDGDFQDWLWDYMQGLDNADLKDFFYNHLNASKDYIDVEYEIEIPEAIIAKANIMKSSQFVL